jgi:hypothetical protein
VVDKAAAVVDKAAAVVDEAAAVVAEDGAVVAEEAAWEEERVAAAVPVAVMRAVAEEAVQEVWVPAQAEAGSASALRAIPWRPTDKVFPALIRTARTAGHAW